jgi:hypothetical protein
MLQKEPKTVEERKEVLEEKLARERNNRSGWTSVSNGIMDNFTDSGRNLDDAERELRLTHKEITEKVAFGILCVLEVYKAPEWVEWAQGWLSGKDRSAQSAWTAECAASAVEYAARAANAAVYRANAADWEKWVKMAPSYRANAADWEAAGWEARAMKTSYAAECAVNAKNVASAARWAARIETWREREEWEDWALEWSTRAAKWAANSKEIDYFAAIARKA